MIELLITKEMASVLKVTAKTFRKWVIKYSVPFHGTPKRPRFKEHEVLKRLRFEGSELQLVKSNTTKTSPSVAGDEFQEYRDALGI